MPAEGADANARRSVVPQAAGRSLWLAAAWTGAGTALIAAVVAIAAVGICWLPASGAAGNAGSAIRAGVLTFLAALHGGLTVDGVPTNFVPLGMTIVVGLLAWRAGTGLADASSEHDDHPPVRLMRAAALQAAVFAGVCGVAAQLSPLGTSSASVARTTIAGFLLFAATGTVAFVRSSGLRDEWAALVPERVAVALRAAAAGVAVYVGSGALLLAGSLLVHHGRVELLSQQVGGGWSGAPVLFLGVLSAPNAAIAGASYLAGPGFAVGSGSGISLGSTVHGTLPAFPLLGAVPSGPANSAAWLLAAATPIVAGLALVRVVRAAGSWRERWLQAGLGLAGAGVIALLLGWVSGGALGRGRLSAVGVSPWRFGFAVAAGTAAIAVPSLAGLAAVTWWRGRSAQSAPVVRAALSAVSTKVRHKDDRDADGSDQLAG